MNKSESKYFNTAVKMDNALLSILEVKDFDYITINEVCKKAGVNRSTFYLHYQNLYELLEETINYFMEKLFVKFSSIETISDKQIETASFDELFLITPTYLLPYLEFIKENKKLFHVVINKPEIMKSNLIYKNLSKDFLFPIMKRFKVKDEEMTFRLSFYVNGIMAIITEWIKEDCKTEIKKLANLINDCVLATGKTNFL
ncbi:MAG: TetR family transcriptional regulator [Clostridiales bacterium]|nr:TetR family transcriptional regulator [Clostridiales bacterium]